MRPFTPRKAAVTAAVPAGTRLDLRGAAAPISSRKRHDPVDPFFSNLLAAILLATAFCLASLAPLAVPAPAALPTRSVAPAVAPVALAEADGIEVWRHARRWTVSSDDVLFQRIVRARIDVAGRVTVADAQLLRLLTFGADGELVRRIDLEGEGPGTVRTLVDVFTTPAGDLAVVQNWPGRIVTLSPDGAPRGTAELARENDAGFLGLGNFDCGGGTVAGVTVLFRNVGRQVQRTTTSLAICDPQRLRPRTVVLERTLEERPRPRVIDETAGYFPNRSWTVSATGDVIVAPDRDRYRLEVHGPGGRLKRVLTRDVTAPRRSRREIAQLKAGFSLVENGVAQELEFRLYETAELIQAMVPLRDGGVLLRTACETRDLPVGVTARFDRVDLARGRVTEVHVAVPWNPWRDDAYVLPTGDLLIVRGGRPQPPGEEGTLEPPALEFWARREGRP